MNILIYVNMCRESIRLLEFNIEQNVCTEIATYSKPYGEYQTEYITRTLECEYENDTLTFNTYTEINDIYKHESFLELRKIKESNLIDNILRELKKLLIIDIDDPNFKLDKKLIKDKIQDDILIKTEIVINYYNYLFCINFNEFNSISIELVGDSFNMSIGLLDKIKTSDYEYNYSYNNRTFEVFDYFKKYYSLYKGFKELKELM